MEIKVRCPDCSKEIKIKLYIVEKLRLENERLRRELQKRNQAPDMPDFFKEIFK